MYTLAVIVAALAVAAGIAFYFAYWPLRKYVYIKTSRTWNDLARLYEFPPEEEVLEETDLFVSSTVMRDACDVIWHEGVLEPPAALFGPLPHGTVVHVNAKHVGAFIEQVLPRLATPIVLVSGCDTVSSRAPGYEALIDSDKILRWFLQNYEIDAGAEVKASKLPLGLNYHKLQPGGGNTSIDMGLPARAGNQQLTMKAIRETIPPLAERPARIYANFQLNMDTFLRSEEAGKRQQARGEALAALRGKDFVFFEPHQTPRSEVWRRHRDFAFEASPHGNGLDCHRTWEALLLKTVPIVKTSPLDSLYDGLPVAIIEDWREIDAERLAAWQAEFADSFDGPIPEQLYSRYWIARFRSFAEQGSGA
jgi:hypothetical protein